MDAQGAAEVEQWEPTAFSGGYGGLHELADREFSGAVERDGTTLYMVGGQVVAVDKGDIETFEDGGTARRAPHPSLPLLYAMQASGKQTRGSYYTEDTPIQDVNDTLSDGGFTGYIELAENVLSGDYYVIYQGGRSTSVAFLGQSRRVITEEDAYERTCDEVGIYDVISVDLDVVEIPGEPTPDQQDGGTGAAVGAGATVESPATDETDTGGGSPTPSSADGEDGGESDSQPTEREAGPTPADDTSTVDETGLDHAGEAGKPMATDDGETTTADHQESGGGGADGDETDVTVVPSIDPDKTARGDATAAGASEGIDSEALGGPTSPGPPAESAPQEPQASTDQPDVVEDRDRDETTTEGAIDETTTSDVTGEEPGDVESPTPADSVNRRDRLYQELAATREERDEFAARVEQLEARLEELTADAGTNPGPTLAGTGIDAGVEDDDETEVEPPDLSVEEALSGTSLFVRFRSKADPTLRDAHAGEAAASTVRENLRIEYHTTFEDQGATVEGQPFEAWLANRPERRFLEWFVSELLFEIRATASVTSMQKLYDAIPEIDRVELNATVSVDSQSATDPGHEARFDLVARGPKGNLLAVADIESSREPTSRDTLAELITEASNLIATEDSLAGSFQVTASYFDPDALAAAEDATGGSLLGRGNQAGFVRHSRKQGYHLCLVERRDGSFHLKQPDL